MAGVLNARGLPCSWNAGGGSSWLGVMHVRSWSEPCTVTMLPIKAGCAICVGSAQVSVASFGLLKWRWKTASARLMSQAIQSDK